MDPEALRARRDERRRETRRRRRLAVGLLVAMATAVVAIVVVAIGSNGSSSRTGSTARSASAQGGAGRSHGGSPATGSTGAGSLQTGAASARSGAGATSASTGTPGTDPVPILMYHVIAAPPAGAPFPGLYVPPAEFAEQMHALKDAGWHAVTLDRVEAYWRRGVPLGPGKPIVLSFDNGYQSQYTQALPVLRQLGWVGVENLQLTGLPPSQGGLGQEEIRGLVAAGWELDTQGFSHADLIALDAEQLHYQVAVARQVVQQRYHVPVHWFCYPSGHYNPAVVAEVRAAGYTGSTTVVPGWAHPNDDPYRLHRLRVLGGTTPQELLAQLADIREDRPAPVSYSA